MACDGDCPGLLGTLPQRGASNNAVQRNSARLTAIGPAFACCSNNDPDGKRQRWRRRCWHQRPEDAGDHCSCVLCNIVHASCSKQAPPLPASPNTCLHVCPSRAYTLHARDAFPHCCCRMHGCCGVCTVRGCAAWLSTWRDLVAWCRGRCVALGLSTPLVSFRGIPSLRLRSVSALESS